MVDKRYRNALFAAAGLSLLVMVSNAFAQTAEQNAYSRYVRIGMEQMKIGNYQAARDSFQEAIRYNSTDFAAHLGLGIVYFHLRDDTHAERELARAAEINPNEALVYQFLGELYYRKDDFETAASYWEKAAALNPSAEDLRARLERIKKERRTEKDFNRDATSHFLIKYEGREKIEAGRIVLRILEDAYGEVGRALSYYPDHEIQVILYSDQQYQEVTDAPGWSGGIFDGKIRIPIGGIEQETTGLRKLLYHEYTHAVVRAITPRCPTWLNEGLAQYFEARENDARQRTLLSQLAQAGRLPSLAALEGPFTGLSTDQAMYAYLFSLSSVRYMIDAFGPYRVKTVLDELAAGASTSKAINSGLSLSYEEFERGWKRSLEQ
ncbi:MAG: peptidase MA family metallohydrolase [Betaproteobacteria bacterium]